MLATSAIVCFLISAFLFTLFLDERNVHLNIDRDSALIEQVLSTCPLVQPAKHPNKACPSGSVRQGHVCVPCAKGSFSFPQWSVCKEFIDCSEIGSSVRLIRFLHAIGNWAFHVAEWRDYEVYYAKGIPADLVLTPQAFRDLSALHSMLQPIGFCLETGVVVFSGEKLLLQPLRDVYNVVKAGPCDNFLFWFRLCVEYVRVLVQLHDASTASSYVMCNSHTPQQLLDQFFVTQDLHLVLGGYDNLRMVIKNDGREHRVRCSDDNLVGTFVAPEQRWPFARYKVFNHREQPPYNEKADIWKVPDFTWSLLAHCGSRHCREILHYLAAAHVRCKRENPDQRPNATMLYREYARVWEIIGGPPLALNDIMIL